MASAQRIRQAAAKLPRHPSIRSSCLQRLPTWRASAPRFFSNSPFLRADIVIKVPQMAESINKGTLSTFLKQVGDRVEADDELASIETDKIDVAVTALEGGILRELLVEEGDVVTVGQPVARIETGHATAAADTAPETEKTQKEANQVAPSEPATKSSPQRPSEPSPPLQQAQQPPQPPTESQAPREATAPTTQPDSLPSYHAIQQGVPSRYEREVRPP